MNRNEKLNEKSPIVSILNTNEMSIGDRGRQLSFCYIIIEMPLLPSPK